MLRSMGAATAIAHAVLPLAACWGRELLPTFLRQVALPQLVVFVTLTIHCNQNFSNRGLQGIKLNAFLDQHLGAFLTPGITLGRHLIHSADAQNSGFIIISTQHLDTNRQTVLIQAPWER